MSRYDVRLLANKIRKHAVKMTHLGNYAHIGSALSIADILAVLYGQVMRFQPENPQWPDRDRFILSKGHACTAVYAALAECGFFPLEKLAEYGQDGSVFTSHISHNGIPGVEVSTGSLGHGLPIGTGLAYAAKLSGRSHRIFVLMGDGECDEGSNWEVILFASHHQLHNLFAIIDYNKWQGMGGIADILALEPFADKWRSFGWQVNEADGHDHEQLSAILEKSSVSQPTCIIAHTTKGKGISFMENQLAWHYRSPQAEDYRVALQELEMER